MENTDKQKSETDYTKPESIYTIFDDFLIITIANKQSFITNISETVFTLENITKIEELFIKNFDNTKGKPFEDKILNQFKGANDNCKHIFTNLLYLRYLPIWEVTAETKVKKINPFKLTLANPFNVEGGDKVNNDDASKEEQDKDNKVNKYFPCVGISSYSYSLQAIYEEMVELIFLFHYLLGQFKTNELNINIIKEAIKNWVLNGNQCKTNFYKEYCNTNKKIIEQIGCGSRNLAIDHMLLNLCDPEKYSRIATMSTKENIVKALCKKYLNKDLTDELLEFKNIDQEIIGIAKEIKERKKDGIADKILTDILWRDDIRSEWEGGYVASAFEILNRYQKQVILYGAPGTGKTYSAEQIIKEFIREKDGVDELEDGKLAEYQYKDNYDWTKIDSNVVLLPELEYKNVIWEMVQFNQSYSYEDFIEGMRPTDDGGLVFVDGIFKRFCNVAKQYSPEEKTFIFVIDEINRGKIDKIFGELLYLLEYRKKELRLHYSNKEFSIPENVYIIGTMNTADKSIALLDVALRRRFWFVRCAPQRDVLIEKFNINSDDKLKIDDKENDQTNIKRLAIRLFDWLNGDNKNPGRLDNLGSDADELKIGHSYFLKLADNNVSFSDLKNIWFYSIVPLIEEYCGFDKNRVEELLKKGDKNLSKKEDFKLENLKGDKKWN